MNAFINSVPTTLARALIAIFIPLISLSISSINCVGSIRSKQTKLKQQSRFTAVV